MNQPDDALQVEPMSGAAIAEAIPALAELRIQVFREWPYIYDGDLDYEHWYLGKFAATPGAVLIAARDGERIVGASTGEPMIHAHDAFKQPFIDHGYDLETVFYFGESVLLPEYRGRGVGHRFFDLREAHARAWDGMKLTTFCAVDRPDDHPLRPASHRPLDPFWQGRGYTKRPELTCVFPWKDVDRDEETEKPLTFWTRHWPLR